MSNPQVKQPFTFNQLITMILSHQVSIVFIWNQNRREREREWQINGVRDGMLDRNGNGMGQKWPLEELNIWAFLVMQINRINKLSIKLGGFQILQFFWCCNICSNNTMFCHTDWPTIKIHPFKEELQDEFCKIYFHVTSNIGMKCLWVH